MEPTDVATAILGIAFIGGLVVWYRGGGHAYTTSGASTVSRFFAWVRWEFDNPTARRVVFYLRETCKSVPLTWFMFGVAFEAFGLGIQYMFAMDTYPLLDFLVAGIVATALYVYQNRKVKNVKLD